MTSKFTPTHPDEFYASGWDGEANRPVVDGKYEDPKTGELRVASESEYSGPPAVDIAVMSLHENTTHCVYRAQRPFAVEKLLYQVLLVIHNYKLQIDSVNATPYAIRVVLAHELQVEEFNEIALKIANGIWDQK